MLYSEDSNDPLSMTWSAAGVRVNEIGAASPSEAGGVWLEWADLHVEVDVREPGLLGKKVRKTIVHGSRGKVRPGELLAVMGPSGAGKSTLFNSLARRGTGYHVSGLCTINGLPYDKDELAKVSAFVYQDALMHSHIYAQETLETAAELKLPRTMSRAEKTTRVQTLMQAFDLIRCAKTKVSGISGGEKKRLSMAIEALSGPSLLFLDEPTTGLDAASSLTVLKLLRELADAGTSVILVLHQPRSALLKFIDTFLILADGRDVFSGPLSQMLVFFEKVELPIPTRVNPVDYVLDIINTSEYMQQQQQLQHDAVAVDITTAAASTATTANQSFAQIMRGDSSFTKLKKRSLGLGIDNDEIPPLAKLDRKELALHLSNKFRESGMYEEQTKNDPLVMPVLNFKDVQSSSFWHRLRALLKREFTQKLRNPEVVVTQVSGAIVLGLVMGSIYYQMTSVQVFNKTSALSFGVLMNMFLVFHLILLFPNERKIWLRDRDSGLYSALEYYLSVTVSGLPGDLCASFLLATILYWMFGLAASAGAFFLWVGIFFCTIFVASGMLYMGGALAPSSSVANSLVSVFLLFAMVFNGFFIVYATIPVWYRWIADINFMRFALSSVLWNEFHGTLINCTIGVDGCAFNTGDEVLISLGVPPNLEVWRMTIYMLIIGFIFHLLAFVFVMFCYTNKHTEIAQYFSDRKKKKEAVGMK